MKKKLVVFMICASFVASLFSGCGSKEVAEVPVVEETQEVEKTESVEPVIEKEEPKEEVPEFIEVEYSFNDWDTNDENLFIFSEGLAWIKYDDVDGEHKCGVIDKEGKLIYSFNPSEIFEGKTARTTLFTNGKAAIYSANGGFIVIDSNGEEVINELGEEKYFCGYTQDGEMFYAIHSTGFSEDSWEINKVKVDGSIEKLDLTIECYDSYIESLFEAGGYCYGNLARMFKLSEGLYIKDNAIFNENTSKVIYTDAAVYGLLDGALSGRVSLYNGFVMPTFDTLAQVDSKDSFDDLLSKNNLYYDFQESSLARTNYKFIDYANLLSCDKDNPAVYDILGNVFMSIPKDVSDRVDDHTLRFDGNYFACMAKGSDDNYYAILVDKSGKTCYEPYKVSSKLDTEYFVMLKGYVFVQSNGEDIVLSPEGEIITDLSVLGEDAYTNYSELDSTCKPQIADGFIHYYRSGKLVSLDGKTELTGVKVEVPYEEAEKNDSSSGDEKSNNTKSSNSQLEDFFGYYEDTSSEFGDNINIGEGYIYVSIGNDSYFECSENYSNINVINDKCVSIEFDDGSKAGFTDCGDGRYSLNFEVANDPYIDTNRPYFFELY